MKKVNNKFRGNGSSSSAIYSLNYKFDSNSIAGKISGTALDLIKKYNDFAKDAQGNGDYVSAEIFRQYAEHYRKIVTEINERKNQQKQIVSEGQTEETTVSSEAAVEETKTQEVKSETVSETQSNVQNRNEAENKAEEKAAASIAEKVTSDAEKAPETKVVSKKIVRKSFKIIEISHAKAEDCASCSSEPMSENAQPEAIKEEAPKRVCRRRKVAASS